MKRNYIFVGIFIASVAALSFNSSNSKTEKASFHKFGAGVDSGMAGAPGDASCTQCHGGSVQAGAAVNTVTFASGVTPVTTYAPGQAYNVAIQFAGGQGNQSNGFQIVAKNSSGTTVGTISIPSAMSSYARLTSNNERATHTSAGSALNSWAVVWTAPATDAGAVTFYLATNKVVNGPNGSGADADLIYTSQHVLGSSASSEEFTKTDLSIAFNPNSNSLNVGIDNSFSGDASINLVDMNGRSVQFEHLGSVEAGENDFVVKLNKDLPKGIYVAHVNIANKFVSKKIMIN